MGLRKRRNSLSALSCPTALTSALMSSKPSSCWLIVQFIDENGGGPGVRLRKRQRLKKPK